MGYDGFYVYHLKMFQKKFTCPACRISYDLESSMKHHLYTHGRSSFFCPDESYKRAFHEVWFANLTHDFFMTSFSWVLNCKLLCFSFSVIEFQGFNRDRHFREVHGQGKCTPCTLCGMKFTRKKSLRRHFENIHNSRETRLPCQFEGCTEEFDDKVARKTHEKSSVHVEVTKNNHPHTA